MSVSASVSIFKAIAIGLLVVNGPVLMLLVGPIYLFGHLIETGVVSRAYNWAGLLVFAAGFAAAWLWWSLSVPRWRLWAYMRVADIPSLKARAVEVGLTWPDGHAFGRTEIKSRSHAARERELDSIVGGDPEGDHER